MLTTIKGYYEHGQIILQELPPVTTRTEVLITFLTDEPETPAPDAGGQQNADLSHTTYISPPAPLSSHDLAFWLTRYHFIDSLDFRNYLRKLPQLRSCRLMGRH